ncbi:MAG: spore gernimation protein [Bacilli bacterium]|nr:spore gernimation protein [Bacilli bacterium]
MFLERGRISKVQFSMILVIIVIGTSIMLVPSLSISLGGRDGWLAPAGAGAIGLLVLFTIIGLTKLFPGQTPVEYLKTLFGKWIGGLFTLVLIMLMLRLFAITLRQLSDFVNTVALPRTPPEVVILLAIAVIYYGVRKGLEVISRVTEIVLIIELVQLVVSVIAFATKDIEWDHLVPLFEHGILPFLRSTVLISGWFGEYIVAAFLIPFIRLKKGTTKAGIIGVSVTTLLLVISNIFTLGIFGEVIGGRLEYGLYEVARYISIANFFERIDPIVMGVWIMLMYCKLTIFCYTTSLGVSQLLGISDYRPMVGVVCLIGAILSQQQFRNVAEMGEYLTGPSAMYTFFLEVIVPLIILGYAMLRKRMKKTANELD